MASSYDPLESGTVIVLARTHALWCLVIKFIRYTGIDPKDGYLTESPQGQWTEYIRQYHNGGETGLSRGIIPVPFPVFGDSVPLGEVNI